MDNGVDKLRIAFEAMVLALTVCLITFFHYTTIPSSNVLLHEISQRLYYVPIIYAAYRFGIKGSLSCSLFSGLLHYLHISEHIAEPQSAILNQYAEIIMFQVVAITTGLFAGAEKQQRQRFEKASAELSQAYKELKDTVNLLMRSARLKSIGEMAASIAHEIRNPLGAIKGAVEIIETDIPIDSPKREFVTIIEKEIERLNKLIVNFLKFARPSQPEKLPADLNSLINSVSSFVAPQAAKAGIKIDTILAPDMPLVLADIEQIRQVLLNLILNAMQAMPGGGQIEISSQRNAEIIEISIRDYGSGIDADKRESIFDPFFTTKTEGSGLGLSVAYQIVKHHAGEIELIDTDGPGSLFVVRLPISTNSSDVETAIEQNSRH